MKRPMVSVFVILTLAMAFAMPAFPQASTGTITGRALDSSSAIIPGVEVTVTSPAMIGGARNAVSDEQGVYRFTLLPVGTYRVSFGLPGFKTLNIDGVTVSGGATMTINGRMEVATVAEEVTVTSTAPTIDLQAATVAVNWSAQKLDNLPSGHDLRNIAQMVPGMFVTIPDIGGTTMGGSTGTTARVYGRSGGEEVSVDGNAWSTIFGDYQTMEEMNISTAAKGAEARAPGASVSMVIKSGGNSFHGSIMGNYEDGKWQSNNVTQELLDKGFQVGNTKFTHYDDYNFELGGRIIKDKLWFYGAFSHQYAGQYINGYIVEKTGEPGVYSTLLDNPTLKLTYQLTNKMKIESVAQGSRKWQPYRNGSALVPQEATQDQNAWTMNGPQVKWIYIVSPTMTMNYSVGRGGYWWPMLPHTDDVRRTDTTTGQTRGAYLHQYDRPIRWQNNGDFSWFTGIGKTKHELKTGLYSEWRNSFSELLGYPNQQLYRYSSASAEALAGQYFLHPNSVQVFDYPVATVSTTYNTAWYLNDRITLNRKLTVNAGVRYERYSSSLPEQGNKGTGPYAVKNIYPERHDFPVYNQLAPRLSWVYDVKGNGRLALKMGYGRYFSAGPGASNVNPVTATTWTFNNWDGSIPFKPVLPAGCVTLTCATGLNSVSGGAGDRTLDPGLKGSWLDEYTAGAEFGLRPNYLIRLNLVRKLDHGGSKNLNLATPYDAYTEVACAVDPGRDNLTGTGDDGRMCAWTVPTSNPNRLITRTRQTQVEGNEGANVYQAYELTLNKQYAHGWSLLVTSEADFAKTRNTNPQNPNAAVYNWQQPSWNYLFKTSGQKDLPYGVMYSTAYYANSGDYYSRSAQMKNAQNSTVTIQVEGHVGRLPWIKLWDNRVSKTFKIKERQSIEGTFDIFNTLNSNAIRNLTTVNGPNFMKPISSGGIDASTASAILTSRTFKIGARWKF